MWDGPSGLHTYIMRYLDRKCLFLLVLLLVYDSITLTRGLRICAIYRRNKVVSLLLPALETNHKIIITMSLHLLILI